MVGTQCLRQRRGGGAAPRRISEWKLLLVVVPVAVLLPSILLSRSIIKRDDSIPHVDSKDLSVTVYSHCRQDRSGAFLQDMLFAHAYAFAHNYTYGGCCEQEDQPAKHRQDVQKLIRSLGLDGILPFQCPNKHDTHAKTLFREEYYEQDTLIWSEEWLSYIRGMVQYNDTWKNVSPRHHKMAVHIRRGDVQVCPDEDGRYLPNSHYLQVIQQYRPIPDTPVYIYSETNSSEPWSDFSKHNDNIHVELDTPYEEAFYALAHAETVVMSKSSFSLVAAMLNPNQVIYTPFWHKPLPNWIVVSDEIVDKTSGEMWRLRGMNGC